MTPLESRRYGTKYRRHEAHAQFAARQRNHTAKTGRRLDIESPYLLSGFSRCGVCGGGLSAHSRQHGGKRVHFYGCSSFWKRGSTVCSNNLVARMDTLDAEVLAMLQDDVCRPAVIEEAIRLAMGELSPVNRDKARERLAVNLAAAREECDRLAEAIGRGGPLDALLTRLTDQQARCAAIERNIQQHTAQAPRIELAGLEKRMRAKLADWRGLLKRNVQDARGVLRALLTGPLRFTPIVDDRRRGYAFSGTIALDKLLAGVVELPTKMASPKGLEYICTLVGSALKAA